jgi:hypothetical protein
LIPHIAFTAGFPQYGWKAGFPSGGKPAFSAPPEQMIRSRARTGTADALFPKSRLSVFSLLFAFGEII